MRGHISQAGVGGGGGAETMALTRSRPARNAWPMGRLLSQPDLEGNSMAGMRGAEPRGALFTKSSVLLTSGVSHWTAETCQTLRLKPF